MRNLRFIYLILSVLLSSSLLCNATAAGQNEPQTSENTGTKDWVCSLPVVSFMGYRFGTPMEMRLMNGPVRVQAMQLWDNKDALYNVELVSFRNETNKSVTAIKLTLSLFVEDAPETILQSWESDSIVFKKPLLEGRSLIDETRPHQISQRQLERSELKDTFELGTIRLRSLFQKTSKSEEASGKHVIEVKVSQIIYGDGTIWGRT